MKFYTFSQLKTKMVQADYPDVHIFRMSRLMSSENFIPVVTGLISRDCPEYKKLFNNFSLIIGFPGNEEEATFLQYDTYGFLKPIEWIRSLINPNIIFDFLGTASRQMGQLQHALNKIAINSGLSLDNPVNTIIKRPK